MQDNIEKENDKNKENHPLRQLGLGKVIIKGQPCVLGWPKRFKLVKEIIKRDMKKNK